MLGAGMWSIVLLLFPAGKVPNRRGAAIVVAAVLAIVLSAVGSGLGYAADDAFANGENPYAIGGFLPNTMNSNVETRWATAQHSYAALSANGHVTVVANTGHWVYRDAPDVAVSTIRDMLLHLQRS